MVLSYPTMFVILKEYYLSLTRKYGAVNRGSVVTNKLPKINSTAHLQTDTLQRAHLRLLYLTVSCRHYRKHNRACL